MFKSVIISLVILFGLIRQAWSAQSEFLNLETNSMEYRLITSPESFSPVEAMLISSGIEDSELSNYLFRYSLITDRIESNLATTDMTDSDERIAEAVFNALYEDIFIRFNDTASAVTSVLDSGQYNCLSATWLYNTILEEKGLKTEMIVLPVHVYSRIYTESGFIDVETTMPNGFDIADKPEVQRNLAEYIGYPYRTDNSDRVGVDFTGMIAVTYANRAQEDFFAGKIESAFQNALKSYVVKPDLFLVISNTTASYIAYAYFLMTEEDDPESALEVLREGISLLPTGAMMTTSYTSALNQLVSDLKSEGKLTEAENLAKQYDNWLRSKF